MERILHADRVVVGPEKDVLDDGAVLVRDRWIEAVGPVAELSRRAPSAPVERHPGCSVTPGLINSHLHLAADLTRQPFATVQSGDRDATRSVIGQNARAALRAGCTTVRDLGDRFGLVFDHRDAVLAGDAVGPRILAAGSPLTIDGGHCWFLDGVADTDDEIRVRVDELAARADVVKVMAGGGQMTPDGPSQYESQYTADQLALVVERAGRYGLPVAAHAHGTRAIVDCIDAGVSTVEHCGWRSGRGQRDQPEEAVRRMAERGVVSGDTTPPQWRRMAELIPQPEGFRFGDQIPWMVDHGVRHVAGTDSGMPNAVFDRLVDCLELYGELGFANSYVLDLVTATNARLLGLGEVTGRVVAGLEADLLVVPGNPLDDLTALHRPHAVMVRGTGYGQGDLA